MVGLLLACGVIGGAAPAALASANVNWGTGVEGTLPSNANANPNVTINAVSCASVGNCVAVGSYVDNASPASTQGLLLSEVSGVWQPGVEAMVPSDTSVVPNATVQRVSCPSAGNCTAIGHYGANPGPVPSAQQGLLLTEVSGTWQQGVKATLPAGADPTNPFVNFGELSCTSPGNCTAIGQYSDSAGTQGLLLTEVSGAWQTGTTAPLPAHATNPSFRSFGITCTSPGNCAAIANYSDGSSHGQAALLTESSGVWSAQVAPLPPNPAPDPGANLFNLVCQSPGNCTAIGSYNDSSNHGQALLLDESSGSWTATEGTAPPSAGTDPGVDLDGLSCVSAGNCTATGEFEDASGHGQSWMLTESSGTWSAGVAASQPNAATATDPSATFDNVQCWSAGTCAAVGEYTDASSRRQGLLVTEASGATQPGVNPGPLPNSGPNPSVGFGFRGLSCPSAGSCTAAGTYKDTNGHTQAFMLDSAPASPSLSASAPTTGTVGTAIPSGSVSAPLSGGLSPVGAITFTVFGPQSSPPSSCSSGGTIAGTAVVSDNGTYQLPSSFTPSTPGDYWWYASYGGDPSDNPAASPCGAAMPGTVVRDTSAPSVSITTPANGATYKQGQVVKASYSCTDPDGPADVASCAGPVASGSPIDTSTPGSHSFKVSAADKAGNSTSKTATYTVTASKPKVNTHGKPSVKALGKTFLVHPGITVSCPAGGPSCTVDETATAKAPASAARAKTKKIAIGRAHLVIRAGRSLKLAFRLNSKGAQLLRKLGHLKITVKVVARVDHNKPISTIKTITIKRPASHKRKH